LAAQDFHKVSHKALAALLVFQREQAASQPHNFHKPRQLHLAKAAWAHQALAKDSHNFHRVSHKALQPHSLNTVSARQLLPLVNIALVRQLHSRNKALARHRWAALAWAHNFHKDNLAPAASQDNSK
jgi:hypothetical protein